MGQDSSHHALDAAFCLNASYIKFIPLLQHALAIREEVGNPHPPLHRRCLLLFLRLLSQILMQWRRVVQIKKQNPGEVLSAAATTPAAPTSASPSASPPHGGHTRLHFLLGRVVNEEVIQVDVVWQDVIPNVIPTNAQKIQIHRVFALDSHLDGFHVSVHADVHPCYGPVDDCAILELDRHRLVV